MLKNKIRVITYLRIGSKDQVTIFRKNEQLRELLEMHKDDWEIIDNAFDYGVSGRKENRPGLNYVLEMCNKNQVDMVVTLTPAMLARDVLLYKDIYTSIRNSEVELYIDELKRNAPKPIVRFDAIPKNVCLALG